MGVPATKTCQKAAKSAESVATLGIDDATLGTARERTDKSLHQLVRDMPKKKRHFSNSEPSVQRPRILD
jgi:hypothetical protein